MIVSNQHHEVLAKSFRLSPEKTHQLLKRLPGIVTKPIPETEAAIVAGYFQRAGFNAVLRPHEAVERDILPDHRFDNERIQKAPSFELSDFGQQVALPNFASDHWKVDLEAFEDGLPASEPAPEPAVAWSLGEPMKARVSIRRKLLVTVLLPTILTLLGALCVIWFTLRPVLYTQLLASARNPAIATAASLSSAFDIANNTGEVNYLQLLRTILVSRKAFKDEAISFIFATDTEGSPLSGWLNDSSLSAVEGGLEQVIREQVAAVLEQTNDESRELKLAGGTRVEVVAQPLRSGDKVVGAIVIGISDRMVNENVLRVLLAVALFSLIPLMLALLFASARARSFTDNVLYLSTRADAISRGALEESVELKSHDELEQLAEALERLRISMQEALERLRRRR